MSTPAIRPQVGLMLSCGEPPTDGRNYPKKLDYIRPKPGALGQYAEYAARFTEVCGEMPRSVDVIFVSDEIGECLDVRPKVWGTSGLKAVGKDNLALAAPGYFDERIRAFDWELITFPDESPEPGRYVVGAAENFKPNEKDKSGRNDPAVTKLGLKVYGTLRVSIPKVTDLMMLAEVSTTSLRTLQNWHNALCMASRITGGVLTGIPFKLMLRPASSRYWDAKEKKRKKTEFFEWVLQSRHTLQELYEFAAVRRQAISGVEQPLALPPPQSEEPPEELVSALWSSPEQERVEEVTTDLPDSGSVVEEIEGEFAESEEDENGGSLFERMADDARKKKEGTVA